MPGRVFSSGSYRHGFNGMEKNTEIAEGNYDFGARIYDGRIGRWWSTDPDEMKYASFSTYSAFFNSPITIIDPTGKGGIVTIEIDESGETYLKVSSTILIYSDVENTRTLQNIRGVIQKRVNDQWNNVIKRDGSTGSPTTTFRNKQVKVVFDIKVEVREYDDAFKAEAAANTDPSVNFAYVGDPPASLHDGFNSLKISKNQESKTLTTTTHELGHLFEWLNLFATQDGEDEHVIYPSAGNVPEDGPLPIMAATYMFKETIEGSDNILIKKQALPDDIKQRRQVHQTDVDKLNYGKGVGALFDGNTNTSGVLGNPETKNQLITKDTDFPRN